MFRKTRVQLTVINAIVFFVVLAVLSIVIYLYSYATIYRDVDRALEETVDAQMNPQNGKMFIRQGEKVKEGLPLADDPRVHVLVWDENGQMFSNYPIFSKYANEFGLSKIDMLENIKVGGYNYRSITKDINIDYPTGTLVKLQFISNTDSQQQQLSNLLLILILGNIAGAVLVVGVGFYLSGRALVPINKAWEKQQQFVSDASHELRTPLTVIQTRSDLLLRHPDATIEEKVSDVSAISKETRRLSKLVTNLLTLARSDSNQIEIIKSEFNLDQLLHEVVFQFSDIAEYQEKSISLHASSNVLFNGDKERIHQLLVILIDNALKFTKAGGEIKISCTDSTNSIQLHVADNGMGIKPDQLPRIFDRFFQGDQSRASQEGTGLGLSIAKWIVEQHGGKIKAVSEEMVGTTFQIQFPKLKKN